MPPRSRADLDALVSHDAEVARCAAEMKDLQAQLRTLVSEEAWQVYLALEEATNHLLTRSCEGEAEDRASKMVTPSWRDGSSAGYLVNLQHRGAVGGGERVEFQTLCRAAALRNAGCRARVRRNA